MMVSFSKDFVKRYRRLGKKLQCRVDDRMLLFSRDKFHPTLENHPLHGKWQGYRSINITGDYRAIYKDNDDFSYFVTLGTHSKLYS